MSSDEKIMDDVTESETGYLEVYIRFNEDYDKDYCFQVKSTDTFQLLDKIFTNLPISLRPSIFYLTQPSGYKVSRSPGYLTEDGSILFDYDTEKARFVQPVSTSAKISDECWPGQLILPKWELNSFFMYSFISFLLVWLYTDLPDFISPTPGICLTNQVTKGLVAVGRYFDLELWAQAIANDLNEPVSIPVQCLFFVLHIIKCALFFAVLWTGVFNPIGFNVPVIGGATTPVKNLKDITREELLAIGWTGSRRASPEDYKEYYREYKIKEHGGLVPAHKAGIFDKLKNLGVFLGEGEGYNTPIKSKTPSTVKDLLKDEDNKRLTFSYEYFALLGEFFEKYSEENESVKIQDLIKQYRRYGLLYSSDSIKKIVEIRKKSGDNFAKLD